jgi:hypothetical protein
MSSRYFKGPWEGDPEHPFDNYDSEDLLYIEYTGDLPTRSVEILDGKWYCSLDEWIPDAGGGLVGAPLSELELPDEWEIPADEFETVWAEALRRRRGLTAD